jgi:hypothetical protein
MTIQKFANPELADYYFDSSKDVVMSTKSGTPRPMTWTTRPGWYSKRVGMVTTRGRKVSYTYAQIKNMLVPTDKADGRATSDLAAIKPDFEYVMFSVRNRCSQYFYAGTSVQEALDRFAKRGERIQNQDIRILNPRTGKVSTLGVQTVETYTLI